ncbi:hypothetical protein [Rhodovulum sulfidophilum]|uniref:hypothetical protein n=1 Tax=Rhodovulum sulfidophilum TaxID=35806 RepID=UPI001920A75E|nr:hypothetical protein [Rhodovulum sulfidophilum]MBL3562593.1 hypothetical protein [Rhodovulum sulfidophilum]
MDGTVLDENVREILRRFEEEDAKDEGTVQFLRKIGLNKLAQQVKEDRQLTRYLDLRESQDKALGWEQAIFKLQETHEARVISNLSAQFEKSTTYSSAVLTLGYAGLFGIWNFLADQLDNWDSALIGFTLGLSLFIYVIWTLGGIFFHSKMAIRVSKVLAREYDDWEKREDAVLDAIQGSQKASLLMLRFWQPIFLLSLIPGLLAAIILLSLAFLRVLNIEFSYSIVWDCVWRFLARI